MSDEKDESAALRVFMIVIKSKAGLAKPTTQTVVVKAHSIYKAKIEAIRKVRRGFYKFRDHNCWVFEKVEEVNNEPA